MPTTRPRGDPRAGRGQPVLPRGDRSARGFGGPPAGIPDTVQGALAARIDLLPGEEKRALQAAAVVGRVFWPGAVAEVACSGRRRGRRGARPPAGPRSRPRAALVFDERRARADLQARAGSRCRVREPAAAGPRRHAPRHRRWIERTYAGRREEVVELIAHHRAAAFGRSDRRPAGGGVSSRRRGLGGRLRRSASSVRSRSRSKRSSLRSARSIVPVRSRSSATRRSRISTGRLRGSRSARPPTSSCGRRPKSVHAWR